MKPYIVSIVLPIHDEDEHLHTSVQVIKKSAKIPNCTLEIILIDDGSKDSSWDLMKQLVLEEHAQIALKLSRNFGKEAAVRAGLERCTGDCAIVMDSDLQHPPNLIPQLVSKWREGGYQIVEALKIDRSNDGRLQRVLSAQFYQTYLAMTKVDLKGASDFKLIDRDVISALVEMPEIHQFFRGMTSWMGYKTTHLPFEVQARAGSKPSWSHFRLLSYAIKSLLFFSKKPLYFVSLFSSLSLILLSIFLAIRALIVWYFGSPPSGTTTIVLALSTFSALISANQTVGNIYIGQIFEQVKARPIYLVSHEFILGNPDTPP